MTATFDGWISETYPALVCGGNTRAIIESAWDAGQESRQAEIEAQAAEIARLIDALSTCDHENCDLTQKLKGMAAEVARLKSEIQANIDILIPAECRVRVCENGGPECHEKTLAVSIGRMAFEIKRGEEENVRLKAENEKLKSASYTVLRTTPQGMLRVECHSCQTHYWIDSDTTKVE